jgi:Cu(I)/Ag(I) efflux system protein CusF
MRQLHIHAARGLIVLASVFATTAGFAQTATQTAPMAGMTMDLTDGEVRKIDKDAGKITLKHGEIKHMDMPPMTMVFAVKDKGLLEKVKTGDNVKFAATNEGGKLTVTDIQVER